jgi:putative nucleotidyltransferase with HDIG domain
MKMFGESQAIGLLERYGLTQGRIRHSRGVAAFAHKLALKIAAAHPELAVDPAKVRLAGLLHDIGRSRPGDHEINSVEILEKEGLPELAALVMHGTIYEIMQLRGLDNPALLPGSVENKIVAYADARHRNHDVTLEDRMAEITQRRKNDLEKIKSLEMAKPRFLAMEKELFALTQ